MRRNITLAACFVIAVAMACGLAWGQGIFVPMYSATHPYSLPLTTSVRCFAMGNQEACVPDDGFANPAYGGLLTEMNARVRLGNVNFDHGPDLDLALTSIGFPIDPGDPSDGGMQIAVFNTSSDAALTVMPGTTDPVSVKMAERDLGIMWGRRCSDRALVGVGISPIMDTDFKVRDPATGTPLVLLRGKVVGGLRLGVVYDISDNLTFGALYDKYKEEVKSSGLYLGLLTEWHFWSEQWGAGLSYTPDARTTLAAELQRYELKFEIGALDRHRASWHFGAERWVAPQWACRVGTNDGSVTAGLGYQSGSGKWGVDYAYLRNWAGKDFKPLFGSSDTHMLVAERHW